MFDLIVVGAGPAGASAAIRSARSGARTLLLERGAFPRSRVCGEFVSAESLGLLAWLLDSGGQDLLNGAYRISRVRIVSDGLELTSPVEPPAASIARFDLDAALWKASGASGVETRQQITVNAVTGNGPFTVAAGGQTFQTRAVINASGRWSNLTANPRNMGKSSQKWLGVKAHFAAQAQGRPGAASAMEEPCGSVDLYFFHGGYCGVQPVAMQGGAQENRINVCAVVRADVASTLTEVFEQNSSLRERSRNWRQLTEVVSTSPLVFRERRCSEGNVLLAGDAAAFVDPFVGDGVSLALRSGDLAARSLMPFFAHKTSLDEAARSYREAYDRELSAVLRNSSKIRHAFFLLPRIVRIMLLSSLRRSPGLIRYVVRHTR